MKQIRKNKKFQFNPSGFHFGKMEKFLLLAALFCFSFGIGLISDGSKLYSYQLKVSQRVDYHSTLNPYYQN